MRRGRFGIAFAAAACALAAAAGSADAARVIVLGAGGHAVVRNDPFLTLPAITPVPAGRSSARAAAAARPRAHVASGAAHDALTRLRRSHAISSADYHRYLGILDQAGRTAAHLSGTRAYELNAVLANVHDIAVDGALTPSRLPVLFLTLDSNRRWWSTGPLLSASQRVEFQGSELVWQYYPSQGLELQELGSFGKADGLYTGGRMLYGRMRHLLDELIPLAAERSGSLAWEYYFYFDGGVPPWTSAMSQGTALLALSRAYRAFDDRHYLDVARKALPIFGVRPPSGVSVRTHLGLRYLLYSFAAGPGEAVINGFLQTLIGLNEYARTSGDKRAVRLFAAGDREAQIEVPHYDTGAWSLYQPGEESSLDYHELVTGFLHELCDRVHARVYCTTAARFDADLKTRPALTLETHAVRSGGSATVVFRLSKVSHVGIVVTRNGQTVFLTSADFGYGTHGFVIPALARGGAYAIRLAATDLAGNFERITGGLRVS
jgi:hypothetical protein